MSEGHRPGLGLRALAFGLAGLAGVTGVANAAPTVTSKPAPRPARPSSPPPRPAAAPLPMLPSVARVLVRLGKGQVVVVEEVLLPRGEWTQGTLDLYVAFAAPSLPRAIDAHLVPLGDGVIAPEDDEAGDPVSLERAPRRPAWASPLLGRDAMAGVVAHLEAPLLARAFAPGGMAALRLRTVLEMPEEDASGGRGLLVRLGASRGTPLTLGRVALAWPDVAKPTRVEARLCGPEADTLPLAVSTTPRLAPREDAVAPVLALRHATDDLCVRWWTGP